MSEQFRGARPLLAASHAVRAYAADTRSRGTSRIGIAGAVVALALAALSQAVARPGTVGTLALAGFLVASVVLAATGRPGETAPERVEATPAHLTRARLGVLAAGIATAGVLGALAYERVHRSLVHPGTGLVAGPLLWLASLAALLVTLSAAQPLRPFPPLWRPAPLPRSRRGRRTLFASLAALFVVAVAARLVDLAGIPHGIELDEGGRTGTAIALLDGGVIRNVFDSSWGDQTVSNMYFGLLAVVLRVLGTGYAQARALGAVSSALTFAVVVWIALRHFGHRVAVLTAILGAALGVSLQFARETTEATPTALLWAVSVAFFLEAARRGRLWAWAGAGVAGGLSLYFYASGRLWLLLAPLLSVHYVLRLGRKRLPAALAGVAACGLAAALTLAPFIARMAVHPDQFLVRARVTSVFAGDNRTHLGYYDPHWGNVQLFWAQLQHSLAIFGSAPDEGGFWPTGRPILGGALTVLTLLALGWFTLSWRSVPRFTLAVWFWVGLLGVVVTDETPDLQRLTTAVPVIPVLAACVLDELRGRVAHGAAGLGPRIARRAAAAAAAGAVATAAALAAQQGHFYFATYGAMHGWPFVNVEGRAVAEQGQGALVVTVGGRSSEIDTGWVELLAPRAARGSVEFPGGALPLPVPAGRDLSFMLFPDQETFVPYLESVYPGGRLTRYSDPTAGLIVSTYRVPESVLAETSGSLAGPAGGPAVRVARVGAVPPSERAFPAKLRWTALLRVPEYWNYSFRLGGGPARLTVDGQTVLRAGEGRTAAATVSLARGEHLVVLTGTARSRASAPVLEWRAPGSAGPNGPEGLEAWRPVAAGDTVPAARAAGLLGTVQGSGVAAEQRLDGAIATGSLRDEAAAQGNPFDVRWTGFLQAPRTGRYEMSLFSQGIASLEIDGRPVLASTSAGDATTTATVELGAGRHAVTLSCHVEGSGGRLEWSWTPPGGRPSIVPPSALAPPPGQGIGAPVPPATLTGEPREAPLVVSS